jgi:hypothetical protein
MRGGLGKLRFREITNVKPPVLNPLTWDMMLLDDKVCREIDRTILMCGCWPV